MIVYINLYELNSEKRTSLDHFLKKYNLVMSYIKYDYERGRIHGLSFRKFENLLTAIGHNAIYAIDNREDVTPRKGCNP